MWIIDKDHIKDQYSNREGRASRDYEEEVFLTLELVKWRVKDDDGDIYYEGRMTKERLEDSEDRSFGPLDFAMADAGATTMEYFQDGKWEQL
jgi:hypothetical protein